MANVTDVEEIVLNWAWNSFLKTRGADYKKLKFEDVKMEVNWTRVKFTPSMPEYSDGKMVDQPNSKIVFTSTFLNNTNCEQEHSFTTERTTVCTATTCISKGYTQGFHLELKVGLPEEVAAATAGFGREVNVDRTDEHTTETVITWSVNSNVKVPQNTKAIAKMEVKEKEFTGKFKLTVSIRGMVIVTFTNLRENNSFIHSSEGDISQILRDAKREGYKIEGKTAIWEVEGTSKFRFGVEQEVHLDQEPL
ncbi:uncharacterized protein LOC127870150 [Dreissena polymorpha]|uniref:Uncharacterized protein n=1 Tax=Dreissena polymorpha TaxID=45954 RepID=A0A9D4RSC7_DREPO|nr:uncharacterized protein LOC127870150 [Dreissena polymorpha]XP_052268776.1 uncharacterized protein LOC127870150 [Dreissena polymorpha]KAH3876945.1 hypothetical protein DPMN_000798 [Dreissena polymorpha]